MSALITEQPPTHSLRVLVVAADPRDARFASRVLEDRGDQVEIADSVPSAVSTLGRGDVDVALVSLSLPRGDGLALVHHLRALYPLVDVICLTTPQDLEETTHAMALGVLQTIMRPLTGDALLVAIDRARERRILLHERHRLSDQMRQGRRRTATYARCAAFVAETDQRMVAERILDACAGEVKLAAGAIYAPPYPGATTYLRTATSSGGDQLPKSLDEKALSSLDPTAPVQEDDEVVRVLFLGHSDAAACAVLVPLEPLSENAREGLAIVASLGTAALTASRKVDAIARTGIKDPETSAYTFAYFGDVAGREIDRAARHGRRFALLTIGIGGLETIQDRAAPDVRLAVRRLVTDAVLSAIRDSDVLARVEDDEFYLLLPETGLLGAMAARRRILARFEATQELHSLVRDVYPTAALDLVCGIGVYPQDGADLGRLLRSSRRRLDLARTGVWHRLALAKRNFWDCVDLLLGSDDDVSVARDGRVTLREQLSRAHDALHTSQHAVLPRTLLATLGATITSDAASYRAAGVVYSAGDDALSDAISHAAGEAEGTPLRTWVLHARSSSRPSSGARRNRLIVDDARLRDRVLLLSLSEVGGYVMAARPIRSARLPVPSLLAFHSSDLDIVDGLVTGLQRAYHLQPEVGT